MAEVTHLISAHDTFDTRIFHKEARSLKEVGHDVTIIANQDRSEIRDGIEIRGVGSANSKKDRWRNIKKIYQESLKVNSDVYHFHHPELIPVGISLNRNTQAAVIYDVHEMYNRAIEASNWIPWPIRPLLANRFLPIQCRLSSRFDGIVGATEEITRSAEIHNRKAVTVRNFPSIDSIEISDLNTCHNYDYLLGYVGSLSETRGASKMIEITNKLREFGYNVGLWLLGEFTSYDTRTKLEEKIKNNDMGSYVKFWGRIDYDKIFNFLSEMDIGLAIIEPNHGGIPTKYFEYMYSELPVVTTPIPAGKKYIENDCGIIVPFNDLMTQVQAIESLLQNEESQKEFGKMGRKLVKSKYNWDHESEKLISLYDELV